MNGKDVFLGLKYVGADLIEQAEFGTFPQSGRRRPVRPLLLAALIALLLMLVGCAVAYVLNIQSMRIENITEARQVLSEDQMDIVGYRDVEMQVLTLAGLKGSPNYMAAQEWYRFQRSYDPNLEKYMELKQADMLEEYPPVYGDTPIYTREMRDTMEGILAKYGLLPPGELLEFATLKKMCTALGIEKLQTADNDVDLRIAHGACYSNGNFYLNIRFSLPESEDLRYYDTWGNLYWCRKDCFTPDYTTIEDTSDWKEWNYTTAAGSEVLIFRSPSDWRGWIVSQREEAQLVLQLEVRKDIYSDQSTESWYLTDRQIELIADAIDFSIQPNRVSQEDVENQLPVPANTWQNGWNVEVKTVKTDGYIVQILLGIAAPEGVDITHVEADDELSHYFSINPGNEVEYFTPENGEKNGYTMSWIPEEDGDGLDNTQNVLMTCNISMRDGSVPFAEGAVWNLHIEDLVHYRWDSQKQDIAYSTLTEGEWCFPIRFGEENGDYRRIELLTQPMILPIITAWEMRGNAVEEIWETTEVSSIQIHPLSVHIRSERANVDYGWLRVVYQDGTQIALSAQMYDANCIYLAEEWIELEQAAYLLLQDGTMIPIPEGTPMT